MQHNLPPLPVRILVVLIVLSAIGYYAFRSLNPDDNGQLKASGTIESVVVNIAPEISGKVTEILVDEGQPVKTGDVLFRIDDTLLQAQRKVAVAGLDSANAAKSTADAAVAFAQNQYDLAFTAAINQTQGTRIQDWYNDQPGEFTLPLWYYDQAEQLKAAAITVEAAKSALIEAQDKLAKIQAQASNADFIAAETNLAVAQTQYEIAKSLNDRAQAGLNLDELSKRKLYIYMRDQARIAKGLNSRWVSELGVAKDLRDAAQQIYDDAKSNLDDAQDAYSDAITTDGAKDVLKARADVSIAQEQYYTALDFEQSLKTGVDSAAVTTAQKALEQAQMSADQAASAVQQAQANIDLLDAQIAKTTITAPVDGVILTRVGELGSMVSAGGTVYTLGRLDDLTLTVYVPEDQYGHISLGQEAAVTVDSFPGETFNAVVVQIADQAEYTPRNVQTVEGRSSTVYAIKLKVTDTEGKLKIGMPADVVFK